MKKYTSFEFLFKMKLLQFSSLTFIMPTVMGWLYNHHVDYMMFCFLTIASYVHHTYKTQVTKRFDRFAIYILVTRILYVLFIVWTRDEWDTICSAVLYILIYSGLVYYVFNKHKKNKYIHSTIHFFSGLGGLLYISILETSY